MNNITFKGWYKNPKTLWDKLPILMVKQNETGYDNHTICVLSTSPSLLLQLMPTVATVKTKALKWKMK